MSNGVNLKSYLKLLRTSDARGYFLLAIFGFLLAKGFLSSPGEIFIFWLIVFLFLGFGFSINDCFDQKEDSFDPTKKNPIVLKKISFKRALFFSISLIILGLILTSFFGLKIFFLSLLAVSIPLFYSAPPLRLKSRPIFDLISHGLFYPLIFISPFLVFKTEIKPIYFLISLSLFYFSIISELRNQWEEFEADKKAGLKNTFNVLGFKGSEKLLRFLVIFSPLTFIPIFLFTPQPYLLFFSIITFLFFSLFLLVENLKFVKSYRIIDVYSISSLGLILIALW